MTSMANVMSSRNGPLPAPTIDMYLRSEKQSYYRKLGNIRRNDAKVSDFELGLELGKGSFGRVVLVKKKSNNVLYAMKLIAKDQLFKSEDVDRIVNERNILQATSFPFIINFVSSFKTKGYLHVVMNFASGGALKDLLLQSKPNENQVRFYAGQIVLALQYLHGLNIVFCDLELRNIVLDERGYLRLVGFGSVKYTHLRGWRVAGNMSYMAPEVVTHYKYSKASDWWSFGVVLYIMIAGKFSVENENEARGIMECNFKFSEKFSCNSQLLLRKLMILDASERLGTPPNEAGDIKEHKWFQETNWLELCRMKVEPPFGPPSSHFRSPENFIAFQGADYEYEPENENNVRFNAF